MSAQNIGFTVRRLVAVGLVRRFHIPAHPRRYVLALNPDLPWLAELRSLLKAMGLTRFPAAPTPLPSPEMAVHESANVAGLEVFGVPGAVGVTTLLGRPGRTVAILNAAAAGTLNLAALARLAEVETDGDAYSLLDPIEADGIFESAVIGQMRLYRLTRRRWTQAFEAFAKAVMGNAPKVRKSCACRTGPDGVRGARFPCVHPTLAREALTPLGERLEVIA